MKLLTIKKGDYPNTFDLEVTRENLAKEDQVILAAICKCKHLSYHDTYTQKGNIHWVVYFHYWPPKEDKQAIAYIRGWWNRNFKNK